MSDDSEPVVATGNNKPTDLNPVVFGMFSAIPWKHMVLLFIMYILLSSDVFISRILSKVDDAVGYNGAVTTKGTIITGLLLVILFAVNDLLIKKNVI